MKAYRNEFSWSKTRDGIFNKCNRMYYFKYYGSWGGWEDFADDRTREIYMLSKLKTRQMWAGEKVHNCIGALIKQIMWGVERIGIEKVVEKTVDEMRKEFLNSKRRNYLKKPKSFGLFEHEYDIEVVDSEWKANTDLVVECLKTFFNSNVFNIIYNLSKESYLEVENLATFNLHDINVYVKLDFAYLENSEIVIYDWKTGKLEEDKHKLQLSCYSLYAAQKFNTKPESIKTVEFYLSSGKTREKKLNDTELNHTCQYIQNSARNMKDLLDDEKINLASENRFDFAENEKSCNYCNFRKVCSRWN